MPPLQGTPHSTVTVVYSRHQLDPAPHALARFSMMARLSTFVEGCTTCNLKNYIYRKRGVRPLNSTGCLPCILSVYQKWPPGLGLKLPNFEALSLVLRRIGFRRLPARGFSTALNWASRRKRSPDCTSTSPALSALIPRLRCPVPRTFLAWPMLVGKVPQPRDSFPVQRTVVWCI